jgi:hypothetical protein
MAAITPVFTDVRKQRSDVRRQMSDDSRQMTDDRCQITDDRGFGIWDFRFKEP